MNKNVLPVLELVNFNISEFEQGDKLTKDTMKEDLRKCCEEHGFFAISGHMIQELIIKKALDVSKEFFSLPLNEKKRYSSMDSDGLMQRGYQERQFELTSGFAEEYAIPDLNEVFMIGKDIAYSDACKIAKLEGTVLEKIYMENIWPKSLPRMKQTMNILYESIYNLSLRLYDLLQYAFDIDLPKLSKVSSELTLAYYPRVTEYSGENQWRIAAHEDHNMFTILIPCKEEGKLEDSYERGGLELLYKNEWHRVLYRNSDLVVNCGHTLRCLSKDLYKSALHRIPMPKPSKLYDNSRYSIAYNAYAEYEYHQHSQKELQRLHEKGRSVYKKCEIQ